MAREATHESNTKLPRQARERADGPAVAAVPVAPDPAAPGPRRAETLDDVLPKRSALREGGALLRELKASPGRWAALLLAGGVLAVIVANMFGQVRLNLWNGDFFNAIERKDLSGVGRQLVIFLAIVAGLLALVVAQTWLHEMLKLRLRAMITRRLLDDWLVPGRAYRLGIASAAGVNPDQRMQEDVRHLSELTADLGIGFIHHLLLLGTFVGVLWVLSAGIALPFGSQPVVVPGYMVWCALMYAGVGSWLAWRIGRPLVGFNAARYAKEAEFRFALVRMSESAEAVALYGGERDERRFIEASLDQVLAAMRRVVFATARLTWITSGYGWLAIVVPTVVALPGYFYGGLTLGGLMMVVGAFNQVQQALRWFVDNFAKIADWRASLHRVMAFRQALCGFDDFDEDEDRIEIADHPQGHLAFRNLSVLLTDGRVLIKEATAEIGPGERVLIVGESGSGKSTLFRAIASLWPWGSGTILLPPRDKIMFMPQRPYLPLGTLATALAYPAPSEAFLEDELEAALERIGLEEFVSLLDRWQRWDQTLSMGEQQRLAFARLLLHRPQWIFLDEATAALDEANQSRVMSIFDQELAGATLVSIGHRAGLERYHTRALELVSSTAGARLHRRSQRPAPPRSRLLGRLRTLLPQRTRPGPQDSAGREGEPPAG